MNLFYDFHIHSALSPCSDDDSTPNNIVNMSKLKGLDVIAISDHNSCLNCRACMEVGKKEGVIVIPSMELTTAEDIHVLCLFKNIDKAEEFSSFIYENMMQVKNRKEIFGNQSILDENDNIKGEVENLLTLSSGIEIYKVNNLVESYGGFAIPAHIDKQSNGLVGVLGFYDYDLGFKAVESKTETIVKLPHICNSDAHYLWDINEATNSLQVENNDIESIFNAIINNQIKKG